MLEYPGEPEEVFCRQCRNQFIGSAARDLKRQRGLKTIEEAEGALTQSQVPLRGIRPLSEKENHNPPVAARTRRRTKSEEKSGAPGAARRKQRMMSTIEEEEDSSFEETSLLEGDFISGGLDDDLDEAERRELEEMLGEMGTVKGKDKGKDRDWGYGIRELQK